MQIKIKGEMTIAELRQELFEKLNEIEDDYAVRHARSVTLYLTLTNGFGDEVIVPDLTFVATINAVLLTGAKPVIVDVDKESMNISSDSILT